MVKCLHEFSSLCNTRVEPVSDAGLLIISILIQKNDGIVCLGCNLIFDKLGFQIFQIKIMVSLSD